MHEVGITQSMLDIAQEHARAQGSTRILSLTMEIGQLSGVVPEAIRFCFEACARGTPAQGAQLIIDEIPALAKCRQCGGEHRPEIMSFACPACGAFALELLRGEELRLKELEVE